MPSVSVPVVACKAVCVTASEAVWVIDCSCLWGSFCVTASGAVCITVCETICDFWGCLCDCVTTSVTVSVTTCVATCVSLWPSGHHDTVRSRYVTVTFPPITHGWRASYGCLPWVRSLAEVLPSKLLYCMQYRVIFYRDISRVYSIDWHHSGSDRRPDKTNISACVCDPTTQLGKGSPSMCCCGHTWRVVVINGLF